MGVDSLIQGGVVAIPTDTAYAYVASIDNRFGSKRIYELKGVAEEKRKPLSILSGDLSMALEYTETSYLSKYWLNLLRQVLPGPYTFVMRASKEVPKVFLKDKARKKLWKRKEVGI